jgi:hypothetical protein
MSAKLLYRISAGLFVLFAAGHTFGFLSFQPATQEGVAVWDAMQRVPVGENLTWGGFYLCFGLDISAYMAFCAVLSWGLGDIAARARESISLIAWSFVALQLVGLLLAVKYVGAPPAVFGSVATILLSGAAWNARVAR